MATILYTWELGGGLGHVLAFRPLAQKLVSRGHRVVAALRDLAHARRAFGDLSIGYLVAPHKTWPTSDRIDPLLTIAHMLHNTGFSRLGDLQTLTNAWRAIFEFIQPDVVIADHSPAALLALRGSGIKTITLGTGMFCPPDESPLPNLAPWIKADPKQLYEDEQYVLGVANELLSSRRQPPLSRLTQLYADADANLLVTFAELDHFPNRHGAEYLGWWVRSVGRPYEWPAGTGPRVFAYFKDFPLLKEVVGFLNKSEWPTVISAPGLMGKLRRLAGPSLSITDEPLDLQQVGRECDVAIQHANHGTLAELLLAGKPTLSLPITMEQLLLAQRVGKLGAGTVAAPARLDKIVHALNHLLKSPQHAAAAKAFAEKYADYSPERSSAPAVQRIEAMLPNATDSTNAELPEQG